MTRLLLLGLLGFAACAAPPESAAPESASTGSAVAAVEVPAPPLELLREGDVLIDREPPPFPDSLRVGLRDEFEEIRMEAMTQIMTEAYGLDSLGREIPIEELLRDAAAEIPDSAKAFVQFTVAWNGTPYRARVVKIYGSTPMPAFAVRNAIPRIRFRPTWAINTRADIPRGTPIPFATYYTIPFQPPHVELLREGDVLFDHEPPPFPDPVLADSIRGLYQAFVAANLLSDHTPLAFVVRTEAFALDSLGREIPAERVLREAATGLPDSTRAFLHLDVAWDGTLLRAEVVHVTGVLPADLVRDALSRIYFRPTWFDRFGPDVPHGTPIPYSARFSVPFLGTWPK